MNLFRWSQGLAGAHWLACLGLAWSSALSGSNAAETRSVDKESIRLYPTMAWPNEGGKTWSVELHAWAGENESGGFLMFVLRKALGMEASDLTPEEDAHFKQRAQLFLANDKQGRVLEVRLGNTNVLLAPTASNGHVFHTIQLPSEVIPGLVTARLASARGAPIESRVFTIPETGWSLVSDIDDTIKFTDGSHRSAMLRNTFCRPFAVVQGMSDLYRSVEQKLGASIHYVSASPWQLYAPLEAVCKDAAFPAGTFHLKAFRWRDESFMDLFKSPLEFKPAILVPLLEKFPRRRFILVGDTIQKDPEVYGQLARKYPAQVAMIWIRSAPGGDDSSKRLDTAFEGVERTKWRVFKEPDAGLLRTLDGLDGAAR